MNEVSVEYRSMHCLKSITLKLISTLFIVSLGFGSSSAFAEDWQVIKMTGEAWIKSETPQKIALTKGQILQLGDHVQTGNNGRVLLKRGKETMLVAPNSIMALPEEKQEPGKTKILHLFGDVLFDVEKRNVKHFEVETPYLAAVVKGTQFTVSVDEKGAKVGVERGKVEVANLETGRFVLVQPGQFASVLPGKAGGSHKLAITGKGPKAKIQQGSARKTSLTPMKRLDQGTPLRAAEKIEPKHKKLKDQAVVGEAAKVKSPVGLAVGVKSKAQRFKQTKHRSGQQKLRVGKAIGPVKIDFVKVTKGLSRAHVAHGVNKKIKRDKSSTALTYWKNPTAFTPAGQVLAASNSDTNNGGGNNNNNGGGNNNNNGGGNNNNNGGNNGNNGNGNGNNGNGNGNNGNGNGNNGNGNGNNGNGNGNNGNGNGNGN